MSSNGLRSNFASWRKSSHWRLLAGNRPAHHTDILELFKFQRDLYSRACHFASQTLPHCIWLAYQDHLLLERPSLPLRNWGTMSLCISLRRQEGTDPTAKPKRSDSISLWKWSVPVAETCCIWDPRSYATRHIWLWVPSQGGSAIFGPSQSAAPSLQASMFQWDCSAPRPSK